MSQPSDANCSAELSPLNSNTDEVEAWPIPVLKEDHHYYMENGFMVFTERYHRARGRCCGNACRHCPFDHVNVR